MSVYKGMGSHDQSFEASNHLASGQVSWDRMLDSVQKNETT